MEFKLETAALSKVTADAIVVGVFEEQLPLGHAALDSTRRLRC